MTTVGRSAAEGAKGAAAVAASGAASGKTGAAMDEEIGDEIDAASGAATVFFPNSAGFHQTTRNAAARPTTTALIKKLARTRVFCN
jgi:hypothetical protein